MIGEPVLPEGLDIIRFLEQWLQLHPNDAMVRAKLGDLQRDPRYAEPDEPDDIMPEVPELAEFPVPPGLRQYIDAVRTVAGASISTSAACVAAAFNLVIVQGRLRHKTHVCRATSRPCERAIQGSSRFTGIRTGLGDFQWGLPDRHGYIPNSPRPRGQLRHEGLAHRLGGTSNISFPPRQTPWSRSGVTVKAPSPADPAAVSATTGAAVS